MAVSGEQILLQCFRIFCFTKLAIIDINSQILKCWVLLKEFGRSVWILRQFLNFGTHSGSHLNDTTVVPRYPQGLKVPGPLPPLPWLLNWGCSSPLYKITQYLNITHAYPPLYFKIISRLFIIVNKCKCYINSCLCTRNSSFAFSELSEIFLQIFLICSWLNPTIGSCKYGKPTVSSFLHLHTGIFI